MRERNAGAKVPILMYHQVTPDPLPAFRKYSVHRDDFAAQMNWLASAGYTSIGFDHLLRSRRGEDVLPLRPVIITFDDGFRECVEHAVPILEAVRFTAIFFLVAGLMGKGSRWLLAERGLDLPLIDWEAARSLVAYGFDCGVHTMHHPHLANLSTAACHEELRASRLLLEDRLGRPVPHLAYPFGSYDERVRAIAAELGYHSACTVREGFSTPTDDPLALPRVPVLGEDSLRDFQRRLQTAHRLGNLVSGLRGAVGRRLGRTR